MFRYITQISIVQVAAQAGGSTGRKLGSHYTPTMASPVALLFDALPLSLVSTLQFEEVADKDDLMGVEDTAKRNILCHPPFSISLNDLF